MRRRRPWVFACIHKTRPFRGLLWSTDKVRSVKSLDRFLEHFFPQGAPSSGKTPPRTEVARGLFGNFLLRHGLSTWCWSFDFILSLDRIPAAKRGWQRYIPSCGGLTASSCYWWRRTAVQVKLFGGLGLLQLLASLYWHSITTNSSVSMDYLLFHIKHQI